MNRNMLLVVLLTEFVVVGLPMARGADQVAPAYRMMRQSSADLDPTKIQNWKPEVSTLVYKSERIGPYLVLNNFWGLRHLRKVLPTAPWMQGVGFARNADGSLRGRIEWDWPQGIKDPEVKGYPEVIFGTQPSSSGEYDSPDTPLPRRLPAIKRVHTTYRARCEIESGLGQLTYDIWLCSGNPARLAGRTHEIMIATAAWGRYGLIDTRNPRIKVPDGVVEIDGRKYQLFYAKEFGTSPGPLRPPWRFIVFQPFEFTEGGTLDLMKFLQVCRERGYITGDEYLAAIEYGVEAVGGKGAVEIETLQIEVE